MKRIQCDRIILADALFDGYVYFENGSIKEVSAADHPVDEEYDATGYYLCAGFIDLHTHGGNGYSFAGSLDEIVGACDFHLRHGTTAICPTVSADAFDVMSGAAIRIGQAMHDPRVKATVLGAHMEGPYLSAKQAGGQCPTFITPPVEKDYLPFLREHADCVARWTYAPENDEGAHFAEVLKEYGIVASAGHTDAIYDDMLAAKKQGCNLVTHLYSCTSTVTRDHGFRRLGVIETAYLLDDLFVEIICDGKHLPPELIRLIYKIKGADKIALITDSLSLAGTSVTHGWMQNTEFIIEDGVCKLLDRSAFAGSIATADRLVRVAVKDAGIPLIDAIRMITETPARIMGLANKGRIAVGADADFVIFDEDIEPKQVFARGESVIE